MTHLSESEFVDVAEGTLGANRAAHLDACATCRDRADDVRAALRAATDVTMPEPSPLFWNHLSARVREGIASEPDVRLSWWRPRLVAALGCAAAILVAIGIAVREVPRQTDAPARVRIEPSPPTATIAEPPADAPPTDAAWALLRDAASSMRFDEATEAGLSVRPGAVDRAVLDLTPAERDALGRLLQDELESTTASRKTL